MDNAANNSSVFLFSYLLVGHIFLFHLCSLRITACHVMKQPAEYLNLSFIKDVSKRVITGDNLPSIQFLASDQLRKSHIELTKKSHSIKTEDICFTSAVGHQQKNLKYIVTSH